MTTKTDFALGTDAPTLETRGLDISRHMDMDCIVTKGTFVCDSRRQQQVDWHQDVEKRSSDVCKFLAEATDEGASA